MFIWAYNVIMPKWAHELKGVLPMENIFKGYEHYIPDHGILIGRREELGLTQEEVAEKAGVTLKQYQSYESCDGREFRTSSWGIVNAVLTALQLDPTDFTNGEYSWESEDGDTRPVKERFGV